MKNQSVEFNSESGKNLRSREGRYRGRNYFLVSQQVVSTILMSKKQQKTTNTTHRNSQGLGWGLHTSQPMLGELERQIQRNIVIPTTKQFKYVVQNCPITSRDIVNAKDMFEPDHCRPLGSVHSVWHGWGGDIPVAITSDWNIPWLISSIDLHYEGWTNLVPEFVTGPVWNFKGSLYGLKEVQNTVQMEVPNQSIIFISC